MYGNPHFKRCTDIMVLVFSCDLRLCVGSCGNPLSDPRMLIPMVLFFVVFSCFLSNDVGEVYGSSAANRMAALAHSWRISSHQVVFHSYVLQQRVHFNGVTSFHQKRTSQLFFLSWLTYWIPMFFTMLHWLVMDFDNFTRWLATEAFHSTRDV